MPKPIVLFMLWSLSAFSLAQDEEPAKPAPLDPDYVGVHGIVLFNHNSTLFASHLPMYRKPHNAQIIYQIESKDPALVFLVRDADKVTIKPEVFNLQRLMRGEELNIKADVYIGHFERDGLLTYEDMEISFTELKYLRMLEELESPVRLQKYDSVELKSNSRLLVHQIQGAPSYDHILLIYDTVNCITQITTPTTVPKQGEIINRLSFCGSMMPVHYETRDFAEGGQHSTFRR